MTTGTVGVAGGELFFEDSGAGRCVVLLHAGLVDHTMWDREFAMLAASHRVVRYDARGHGRSSTPAADYSHADDLQALLSAREVGRAVLMGLSGGARTAIDFTLAHPEMVEALMLASPGISGMVVSDPFVIECYERQMEAAASRDAAAYIEWWLKAWVDGPHREPAQVDSHVRERCRAMAMATLRAHHAATGAIHELHAIDRLAEIRCPVLAVEGDRDVQIVRDHVALLSSEVHGARKVTAPGAGHFLNLESPGAFMDAATDFLNEGH